MYRKYTLFIISKKLCRSLFADRLRVTCGSPRSSSGSMLTSKSSKGEWLVYSPLALKVPQYYIHFSCQNECGDFFEIQWSYSRHTDLGKMIGYKLLQVNISGYRKPMKASSSNHPVGHLTTRHPWVARSLAGWFMMVHFMENPIQTWMKTRGLGKL